jgi:hypothetical protein
VVEPQAHDRSCRGFRLNRFSAIRARFWDRLRNQVASRVQWVTDQPRNLLGQASLNRPWVVILGRERYQVDLQRLPISSWLDARRTADLMRLEGGWSMAVVGDWDGSHRTVAFYKLTDSVSKEIPTAPLWFFETQLLSRLLSHEQVFLIERFGFRYFFAPPERSQVAGSLIDNPVRFALSVGASEQAVVPKALDAVDLSALLLSALGKLRLSLWVQAISRSMLERISAVAVPAVAASVLVFGLYLLGSTAYLWGMKNLRERQLAALGPEVATLLETQRNVDTLAREVNAVSALVNSRVISYQSWSLIPAVWDSGGVVFGVAFKEDRAVVRGATADATGLLSVISQNPSFESVRFESPVRESSGRQDFSIGVSFASVPVP